MNPDNNDPWRPQPYKPHNTAGSSPISGGADIPQPTPPTPLEAQEEQIWQRPVMPNGTPIPQPEESGLEQAQPAQAPSPDAQKPAEPNTAPVYMPPAAQALPTPQPQQMPRPFGQSPNNQNQPQGKPQQFGGPMAELPPLAQPNNTNPAAKPPKKRNIMRWVWIALIALIVLPAIGLAIYFVMTVMNDNSKKEATQEQEKLSYNLQDLQEVGKAPTADNVKALDKTTSFYTVFKNTAAQSVVQTKWNVYYTEKQDDPRADQYTMYDTTINYKTKQFAYTENTASNLGVYQTRCLDQKQYNYNDSKLTTAPTWQLASDSTDCQFSVAALHFNDGVNTGGLNSNQADDFIRKIKSGADLKVNSLALETYKEKPYLKFEVTVTPKQQADGTYIGMQAFMNAFQATGLDPKAYPYNYFGAGGEGMKMTYYVDPVTQLPVHAVIDSTAAFNAAGQPVEPKAWTHRFIEYVFPKDVVQPTLNDHAPITFTTWPDAKLKQ